MSAETRSYDGQVRHDNKPLVDEAIGGDKMLANHFDPLFRSGEVVPPPESLESTTPLGLISLTCLQILFGRQHVKIFRWRKINQRPFTGFDEV